VKPGESTTSGRLPPAGFASVNAWVLVRLSTSGGTSVIPVPRRTSSDSFGDMYGARRVPGDFAGYHRETMSSLAPASGTHGSWRELSVRCSDVVPTGSWPVGAGRKGAVVGAASATGVNVAAMASSPAAVTRRRVCLRVGMTPILWLLPVRGIGPKQGSRGAWSYF
jgi:hypothetical protein